MKVCFFCRKEFTPKLYRAKPNSKLRYSNAKFCSPQCSWKANYQNNKDYYRAYDKAKNFKWKGIRKCKYCGLEFEAKVFNQEYCTEGHRKYAWKKVHWEQVKKSESTRLKRKRKENPEYYRHRVRTRRALRKETSGLSGKTFNRNFTLQVWEEMKKLHEYTCLFCKRVEPEIKLTIDHIIPLSKGGKHLKKNIQPLCFSCNSGKRDLLR